LGTSGSGLPGEAIILLVLVFAVSRQIFGSDRQGYRVPRLLSDPEFRLAMFLVTIITAMLFLRHWVGAYDFDDIDNLPSGTRSLWGTIFTVTSFMTTTGFASTAWSEASNWSGLATPGILLMGMALIGGGVATTAGGVKLLRVYALYKHGMREMDRLVHPSSVGGAGTEARKLRRQGAHVAWVFFMLFALSLALTVTLFGLVGVEFEDAIILAIAALSTTGPLVTVAAPAPIDVGILDGAAKIILAGAMVLGRLETLAIIALLNPGFWRA